MFRYVAYAARYLPKDSLSDIISPCLSRAQAGHRWLTYLCDHSTPRQEPVQVFRDNVRQHFAGKLKGPFNAQDRGKAGLTKEWYEDLVGEKSAVMGVARTEVPGG